ncbi:hypothetical protein GF373_17495 [bacterium]|nr:hypothetical protein [bacterium]
MKVFDKIVVLSKNENGEFTISLAISDQSIVIRSISERDLRLLRVDLDKILEE